MKEESYYIEIENYIKRNEINKRRRALEENYDTLNNYWNIGRLLVEAQGGKIHAKRGEELIKKWSIQFTKNYGKGYDATNLRRFRQLYLIFPKCGPAGRNISWTHFRYLIPIKEENKRNYYINEVINNNLSVRQLREEIKSKAYERLLDKPKQINLVLPKDKYTLTSNMKNPIIIKIDKNKMINNEKDLEITILS